MITGSAIIDIILFIGAMFVISIGLNALWWFMNLPNNPTDVVIIEDKRSHNVNDPNVIEGDSDSEEESGWMKLEAAPLDGTIVMGFFPFAWEPGFDYVHRERRWTMVPMRFEFQEWIGVSADLPGDPIAWKPMGKPPSWYSPD